MTLPAGVTEKMLADALDSLTVAALAQVFSPRHQHQLIGKSYSAQIAEILAPRLTAALAGCVVVPREPTPEQRDAIELSLLQEVLQDYAYILPTNGADLLYAAMIAAAVDGGA